MALKLNLGQINSAAKNNNDLRETLTGVYNELQAVYQQIGSAPIQKVDTAQASFSAAPPQSQLSVTGANGQFSVSVALPQSSRGGSAPKNPTNAPIYQELSSSPVANFSSGVVTYPVSTSTTYLFPNPGATLYWRLRSSYDQKTWSSYQVQPGGPVAAGKQTSSATENNLALNQALATDAMRAYRSGLESALKKIPGAELAASRDAKNPPRLAEKIELEGQPAETVNDYGAAQISVDSPQTKDAVIAAVREKFPVVRVQDHFAQGDPEYGYRSYSMQLQMPNGASQELQIVPREVFEANHAEHHAYKTARNAEIAGKNADAIRAAAKAQNDTAMAKFNARNSLSELRKGSVVRLPDGSKGRVSYLDPNMKIARVRTEDGRNLTIRQNQLKVAAGDQPSHISRKNMPDIQHAAPGRQKY